MVDGKGKGKDEGDGGGGGRVCEGWGGGGGEEGFIDDGWRSADPRTHTEAWRRPGRARARARGRERESAVGRGLTRRAPSTTSPIIPFSICARRVVPPSSSNRPKQARQGHGRPGGERGAAIQGEGGGAVTADGCAIGAAVGAAVGATVRAVGAAVRAAAVKPGGTIPTIPTIPTVRATAATASNKRSGPRPAGAQDSRAL